MSISGEHELASAIGIMERKVDEAEKKLSSLLVALNVLRSEAGLPPRVGGALSGGSGGGENRAPVQIKADTFFGKKQQTAVRQYLEMRKSQGLSTAKPREIYDALKEGGYEFEAKSEETALVGLRALLRKRTETFAQLGNGTYGLVAWYPEMRRSKSSSPGNSNKPDTEDGDEDEKDSASSK